MQRLSVFLVMLLECREGDVRLLESSVLFFICDVWILDAGIELGWGLIRGLELFGLKTIISGMVFSFCKIL